MSLPPSLLRVRSSCCSHSSELGKTRRELFSGLRGRCRPSDSRCGLVHNDTRLPISSLPAVPVSTSVHPRCETSLNRNLSGPKGENTLPDVLLTRVARAVKDAVAVLFNVSSLLLGREVLLVLRHGWRRADAERSGGGGGGEGEGEETRRAIFGPFWWTSG